MIAYLKGKTDTASLWTQPPFSYILVLSWTNLHVYTYTNILISEILSNKGDIFTMLLIYLWNSCSIVNPSTFSRFYFQSWERWNHIQHTMLSKSRDSNFAISTYWYLLRYQRCSSYQLLTDRPIYFMSHISTYNFFLSDNMENLGYINNFTKTPQST